MDDEQEPQWDLSQRHEYLVLTRDDLPSAASQFAGYHAPGRLCFYITLPRPFRRDDRLQFCQDDERALHETMAELHAAIWKLSLANEPCEDHPPETHLVIHIEYADAAAEEEQAEGVAVDTSNSKGAGSETNDLKEEAMPHFGRQDGVANTPLLPSITAFTVSSPMPFPAHEATFYQMARRMPNLKFLNISAGSVTLNTPQHTQLRNELADSLSGLPQTLREIRITSTDYYYSPHATRRRTSVQPRSDADADEPDRVTLAVRELLHMPNLTHVSIAMGIDWELFCTHKAPGLPVKRGAETFPTLMVSLLPYWAPSGGPQPEETSAISKRHKSNKSKSGQQQQQPTSGSTSQQKKQPQPTTSVAYVDEVCFHAAKLADVMPGDFTFLLDIPGFSLDYYCWRDTLRIDYRPSALRPAPKTAKDAILSGATRAAWRKTYERQRHRPGNFKVPRPKDAKLSFEINSRAHTEFV